MNSRLVSLLCLVGISGQIASLLAQPTVAPNVILEAPPVPNGSYLGMYCDSCITAAFTLASTYDVTSIDVFLRTPASTSFTTFNFSLQDAPKNPSTIFATATFSVPLGTTTTRSIPLNKTLVAGTYYLVGNVPGYAGTPVTAGDVDGWVLSTGVYNTPGGTILGNPSPAFRVNGYVPVVRNAANPASTQPVSPGSLVSIFGANFSDSPASADSAVLPKELGGVTVTFNGIAAPLLFVSSTQINAQVPWELLPAGAFLGSATVVIKTTGNPQPPITVPLSAISPSIFTLADNQGAVLIASDRVLAAPVGKYPGSRPVRLGEYISIFCTGLGPVVPPQASGEPAPSDPLAQMPILPSIVFKCKGEGNQFCSLTGPNLIQYAGLAPGFVGLYQVNVRVPEAVETGDAVTMLIATPVGASSAVTIAIAP